MFGQSTQQPSTSGGLFGNASNTNQGTNTGGGLFGNTGQQQQPAAGTSLFGASSTTQPSGGGGLFGNTNPTGQQQSTGLFGSTSNQPSGGGVFGGATQNQSGGLFGSTTQPPGSSSLFGNTQNQPAGGGGLFGSTIQPQQQQQPQPSGNPLFGNTNTAGSGSAGGGLFGGAPNTTPNQGGGLFGSTTSNTTGGGLFGNTTGSSASVPSGGLFAQSSNQNPAFGGQSTTTAQGSSLFGQPQQSSVFGGGAGQSTSSGLFGSASTLKGPLGTTQNQTDPQGQFNALVQRIDAVKQAWDSSSPQCRFQHYFYNLVDPNQIRMYGRPANATNEALWQKAVRENPDPSCLVPVLAVGFDDLQKRVDAQTRQASAHQEKLQELKKRIETLSQRHELSNAPRLHRASALQTQLMHRLLKLVQHLHLFIPALRSSSIKPEEEALRAALEEIDEEIRRPGGMGRMRGKLNELWAIVGAVHAARERNKMGGTDGNIEWAVVDEDGLARIAQILAEQQAGLAHLTKILQKDMNDLAVIYGTAGQEDSDMTI